MLRQGAPSPEFTCPRQLREHYRAVRHRLLFAPATVQSDMAERTRSLAEAHRERIRREIDADEELQAREKAERDALVFTILDPNKINREPKKVIARVAKLYGLTAADITGKSRAAAIIPARFAAIVAVREARPDLSLQQLGKVFQRDHTSILNALRRSDGLSTAEIRKGMTEGGLASKACNHPVAQKVSRFRARR